MSPYLSSSMSVSSNTATLLVDAADIDRELIVLVVNNGPWHVGFTSTDVVTGANIETAVNQNHQFRLVIPTDEQIYVYQTNGVAQVIDFIVTKAPIT